MDTQLATIDTSKKELFKSQSEIELSMVKSFQVTDSVSMNVLAGMVSAMKEMKAERTAFFKPHIDNAMETKRKAEASRKAIVDDYEASIKVLDEGISIANRKNQAFLSEEQRKSDEIARQEQARIRKIEENKRLAEAQRLEAEAKELAKTSPEASKKMEEQATKILDEPIVTEVVRPAEVAKPAGYSERRYWKARVIRAQDVHPSYKTPCKECGTLVPNMKVLNSLATESKGIRPAPLGVEFYEDVRPY